MEKGWLGYAGEGGLVLNLIKAMSFKKIPFRHRATYIEALYAQNVVNDEDRYDIRELLKNIGHATEKTVSRNFDRMASRKTHRVQETYRDQFGSMTISYDSSGSMLDYFPGLERSHFLGLMKALGNDAIFRIAEIFARNPYEYRKGWPDLTIWQGSKVAFKEVKAPGDTLQRSQRTIIKDILLPLNLDVSVIDICVKT